MLQTEPSKSRLSYLLDAGLHGLVRALIIDAITRPRRWLATIAVAMHLGRRSERGVIWHLIYFAEACLLRQRLSGAWRQSSPRSLWHERR